MTLALYCSLGACSKCGGKRCACTCHGGRVAPPQRVPRARDTVHASGEEIPVHKCRFCPHTSPNAQGRAAHERWCAQNPDRRTAMVKGTNGSRAVAPVVVDPPPVDRRRDRRRRRTHGHDQRARCTHPRTAASD